MLLLKKVLPMLTMSTPPALRRFPRRRPQLMLLFASLILVAAILYRSLIAVPATSDTSAASAPVEATSPEALARWQARLARNPDDVEAYAQLGLGLLRQVRVSGDMALYDRAGQAFQAALARDPKQVDALVGQGVLALALHDFAGALTWAEQAWALNPFRAEILGIKVDGLVELGRYDEAVATLQQMIDLRPDLESYSRVSYLRELHGDVDGAIAAMQTAVESAAPGTEDWAWTLTHLGNLYFNRGDRPRAVAIYQQVLAQQPHYPYAVAGLARGNAAEGKTADALTQYQELVKRLPLPEFVIALGELYEANGQTDAAQAQYDLVGVMQQLNAAAGMNVDLEMALFNASHGANPAQTVTDARAAYAERPTIYGADALAWALYQTGDYAEAWTKSQEALRLDTKDAALHFHAGMIAQALGDATAAHDHLETALAINPYFSPLYGPVAAQTLAALAGE